MKTLRKFLGIMLLLTAIAQTAEGQEAKYASTVLIKLIETTYEGVSTKAESKIIIVKPDNSIETKVLERASVLKDGEAALGYNLMKIRTELQLWQNEGYRVQASSSASPMTYLMITTIILIKD